jgi:hypothetical protein
MVGLANFVVDKLPYDGTLVLKHLGVGTWCEACFVICLILF